MTSEQRGYITHSLKTWPEQFEAVWRGEKLHEVRKFDRDYRVDDTVYLYEFDPTTGEFGSRTVRARISHITAPGSFGLPADVGVFTLGIISRGHATPNIAKDYCEGKL
jgi:Domain of unknown function (DUF3850)